MLRRIAVPALTLTACCLAPAGAAAAVEPARMFDAPGQKHAAVCAQLARASVPLRYIDGRPTGLRVGRRASRRARPCPTGSVRLDLHEVVRSPRGPLVFHRGGFGYPHADRVAYGFLARRDLAGRLPPPAPSGHGRGAPCRLAVASPYAVRVRPIPTAMHYKPPWRLPPGASDEAASFSHYGDPAAVQAPNRGVHFSYLLWSFLDVRGGGAVRSLLAPGERVRRCAVAPRRMPAWDARGRIDGFVTARYVRAGRGTHPLYGWMVWSHVSLRRADADRVVHAVPVRPDPLPPAR